MWRVKAIGEFATLNTGMPAQARQYRRAYMAWLAVCVFWGDDVSRHQDLLGDDAADDDGRDAASDGGGAIELVAPAAVSGSPLVTTCRSTRMSIR